VLGALKHSGNCDQGKTDFFFTVLPESYNTFKLTRLK